MEIDFLINHKRMFFAISNNQIKKQITKLKTTQIKNVQELAILINHLKHHSYLILLSSRLSI